MPAPQRFEDRQLLATSGNVLPYFVGLGVSVDLPSIAADSTGVGTIAVPGVAVGDIPLVSFRADFNDDLVYKGAHVSAAGTVQIRVYNPTIGAIDAAAVTTDVFILDLT